MLEHELIHKKRISRLSVVLCLSLVFTSATACGRKEEHISRIEIDKEGVVTSVIYENFSENYYDVNELSDMASSEISYYNSEYISPKINMDEPELIDEENLVKLSMTYDSSSDYSHFNQTVLFYGTVEEAKEKGYAVSGSLVNADGETITPDKIADFSNHHILITTEKTNIIVPHDIVYMTKGVSKKGKKEADLTGVIEDTVQLLLSK